MKVFTARDFESHYQVWQSAASPDGRMFFGSFGSVLEFNGSDWKRHVVPTSFIRALIFGTDGSLYVSSDNFFGRFSPDGLGSWKFESLADRIPESHAALTRARTIITHPDGIFGGTHDDIIRWHGEQIEVFDLGPGGNELFNLGATIMNRRPCLGVWQWTGDTWELWAEKGPFASEDLGTLLEGPTAGSALFAGSGQGVSLIKANGEITPWSETVNAATEGAVFYCSLKMRDGRYVFGTIDRGIRANLDLIPDDDSALASLAAEIRLFLATYQMEAMRNVLDRSRPT
jgi:hypothetical protein